MDKKREIIAISIVGILLIITIIMGLMSFKNGYNYEENSKVFENISDLDFLNNYVIEENIDFDKKISEESISESKTVKLNYNGETIYVYAYVFKDTNKAIKFANKVSGNNYFHNYNGEHIGKYYHKKISFFNIFQSQKLLVLSDEKAYVIKANISDKKFNEFIEYFMAQLPTKFEYTY